MASWSDSAQVGRDGRMRGTLSSRPTYATLFVRLFALACAGLAGLIAGLMVFALLNWNAP